MCSLPCWIALDHWIQITKPWPVNLKSFPSTAYWPQILLTRNIPKKPQRSAAQINLSLRVLRFKFLCMRKRCDGSTGDLEADFVPFPLFIALKNRLNGPIVLHGFWEAKFKMNYLNNIQILIYWTVTFRTREVGRIMCYSGYWSWHSGKVIHYAETEKRPQMCSISLFGRFSKHLGLPCNDFIV